MWPKPAPENIPSTQSQYRASADSSRCPRAAAASASFDLKFGKKTERGFNAEAKTSHARHDVIANNDHGECDSSDEEPEQAADANDPGGVSNPAD